MSHRVGTATVTLDMKGGGTSQTIWQRRGAIGELFLPPPLVLLPLCLHRCDSWRGKGGEGGEGLEIFGEPITVKAAVNC